MKHQPPDSPEIVRTLASARAWVRASGFELNRSGTGLANLEDALIIPLDPESRKQFADGAGRELRRLHSLRSSSALAYNTFAPWKADPTSMAVPLGGTGTFDRVAFEAQYPTGVSSRHPHLDVVVDGQTTPVAVESKFLEIYDDPKPKRLSPRYLDAVQLWAELPNLKRLAEELTEGATSFERIGAEQLIKHTLGLTRKHGHDGFRLVYLWYEIPGAIAEIHIREVEAFAEIAGQDIDFLAVTYQEFFHQLGQLVEPLPGYLSYLGGRYFAQ